MIHIFRERIEQLMENAILIIQGNHVFLGNGSPIGASEAATSMRVPRHPPHHLLLWSAPAILFFNSWVFRDRSRAIAAPFLLQQPLESQKVAYGLNGLK